MSAIFVKVQMGNNNPSAVSYKGQPKIVAVSYHFIKTIATYIFSYKLPKIVAVSCHFIKSIQETYCFSYKLPKIVSGSCHFIKSIATYFFQLQFDPEIFFYILLPPIIFFAGYDLKKVCTPLHYKCRFPKLSESGAITRKSKWSYYIMFAVWSC